ncbi:glucose-6-phosphate isomerase [Mycoplasma sp. 1654_15]|uniref:glucose-6-phosphate isomerase n=1 Tax=Mycoplasma sp. 1654_15 TaxID=2725994 RepID=UPI001448AC02|nr:glucose-6-phosphate isomerase [Mycoplasma sp. 1654_15]QJB71003.1 glucose-6-phosphate isomerase [Mycoplasma sp. 1654_15]
MSVNNTDTKENILLEIQDVNFDWKSEVKKLEYQRLIRQNNNKINSTSKGIPEKLDFDGQNFLGWANFSEYDWLVNGSSYSYQELIRMQKIKKRLLDKKVELLVVIGIGGSYLGAKAAIDFINGSLPNIDRSNAMEVMFVGTSLSSADLYQKLSYASTKRFAINVISKSGTTIEPAIAFREFRKLLENQENGYIRDLIFVTTDRKKGALLEIAKATVDPESIFRIPDDMGGRFSVLSAVGFFPMLCAGIDVKRVIKGASLAAQKYSQDLDIWHSNPAYVYALIRFLMYKKFSKKVEILIGYEPYLAFFNEWWKQLFGESEGKDEKGLLPASVIFSTDLHSLGQFIQQGSQIFFETTIFIEKPMYDLVVSRHRQNQDNLNTLADNSVSIHTLNQMVFQATLEAHSKTAKIPNIVLKLKDNSPETFGWLVMFFERACAMSAFLLEVNPFNQPGVEVYKHNLKKILSE